MQESVKISSELSSKILSVGPVYVNHRGGVGAVIEVYSHYYDTFNFLASHRNGSAIFKSSLFFISLFRLTGILLTNRKIKLVHIHGASYGSFYRKFVVFLISKFIFRKAIVYHVHGGGFQIFYERQKGLSRRMIRFLMSRADVVICLSQSWRKYYEDNFKIKKLIVLPNIIDYPEISERQNNANGLTFLFLGLVGKAKGIFDLIEVIVKNKEQYRGKMKLLIGGNGETALLKDLIKKHKLEELVEFLGWITDDRKIEVLNGCDVFILPSYNEGLPISVLESMSYGKAIISTKVGGIPEIVHNGENGLLIDPGNLDQLENALNFFIEHPDTLAGYGRASVLMVRKHMPEEVIKELENIYKSVLK